MEVHLSSEVRLVVFADVMIDECDGDDERQQASMILLDDFDELLFFFGSQHFLEIPHHMIQDVDVLLHRGL